MNAPSRTANGAISVAVIGLGLAGLLLAGIACWLGFGVDHAMLEFFRRDLAYGWLLAIAMPRLSLGIGLLGLAFLLGAWWLQSRARRA